MTAAGISMTRTSPMTALYISESNDANSSSVEMELAVNEKALVCQSRLDVVHPVGRPIATSSLTPPADMRQSLTLLSTVQFPVTAYTT